MEAGGEVVWGERECDGEGRESDGWEGGGVAEGGGGGGGVGCGRGGGGGLLRAG